ncbi:hypothetical protein BC938DRAFT_479689, partial [Jimgerdemannia flammicorona]
MEEALRKARQRLKKTPISRDASDAVYLAKAAISKGEIDLLQKRVIEADLQNWLDILRDHTFKTQTIALTRDEASALVVAGKITLGEIKGVALSSVEQASLDLLQGKIDDIMRKWDFGGERAQDRRGWFVKTSRRSPKDAVIVGDRIFELYKRNWQEALDRKRKQKQEA